MKNKLAFFGGSKTVSIPHPHFVWPSVHEEDINAVTNYMKAPKAGINGMMQPVEAFENSFKNYHSAHYSLSLNSATSCLHTAYYALGIGPGDEVIVPSFTFPATALPLLSLGAIPVLCDCQRDTSNIDPEDIKKKITSKTKAIAITHLWGHPCEMDEIMKIATSHNIPVVEDCAHSPGAKYKGKLIGTFGDISCFSFDNNKLLASGEAGIMLFKSQDQYEKAIVFSDFGPRMRNLTIPEYKQFGDTGLAVKYRIHPIAAVIANEKFKRLKEYNSARQELFDYFYLKLKEHSKCIIPPVTKEYVLRGGYYGFKPIYLGINNFPIKRYIELLSAEGVDIRQTITPPLHRSQLFKDSNNWGVPQNTKYACPHKKYTDVDLPNASWFQDNHLSFATFNYVSDKQIIDQYIKAITKVEEAIENNSIDLL